MVASVLSTTAIRYDCGPWHDSPGTALVTIADARQADSGKTNSVGGDLLVLLSGLCYAAYTVGVAPYLLAVLVPCSKFAPNF